MNLEIIELKAVNVHGLSIELTRSQRKNYDLISRFWPEFNRRLKIEKINVGSDWQKYGIIYKSGNSYRYLCAVPECKQIHGFKNMLIANGKYAVFQHVGKMIGVSETMNKIYKQIIPDRGLKLQQHGFLHFEKYDYRFNWNNDNSLFEIYLPINDPTTKNILLP